MIDPLNVPALTAGFPRNLGKRLDDWKFGITVQEVSEYADSYLLRLPGIGRKAVADIRAHIAAMRGPVAGIQTYLARDPQHLVAIATVLAKGVRNDKRPQLAAAIIDHDLMRGPWWFQLLVGLIRLRGRTRERLTLFYRRNPEMASDLIRQTALHIVYGKDREDKNSVGGLSQRELDLLVGELRKLAP